MEGKKPWATFGTTFPVPSLPRMCLVPPSVLHQEILWTRLQDSAKKSQSARKTSCSAALLHFGRGYRELHLHTATVQRAKQSSLLCYNDGKLHMVKGWEYVSMRSKHQMSTQIRDKNLMKEYDNIESQKRNSRKWNLGESQGEKIDLSPLSWIFPSTIQ